MGLCERAYSIREGVHTDGVVMCVCVCVCAASITLLQDQKVSCCISTATVVLIQLPSVHLYQS